MLVFGGQSSEHEVSCVSATTIAKAINKAEYQVYLVGITKEGKWLAVDNIEDMQSGEWTKSTKQAVLSPDATKKELIIMDGENVSHVKIDVAFPALHGLYGEDGTIQGLFELAKIPYVGCGVLASAVSMDKVYTKIVVDTLGINQAQFVYVTKEELMDMEDVLNRVEAKLSYPVFVKPSNAGSSCGVTKAENRVALKDSLLLAAQHDRKILVEETIVGRELECAVLGNQEVQASGVGEILAAEDAAFYDYDAKYNNAASKTVIGPELPEGKEEEIREAAKRIFKAVDGSGLARVDFFLEKGTNRVVFNELNTLPGFTSISMYPMLWKDKGLEVEALVEKLITLAGHRFFTDETCKQ
ncbi:MAG: D-alanine--D-alanine ligase [Lachnospiraceae bacterium]|jgi:D-alanine-D-alanine ligase|nr:D-alanine--D-alanine ligase [Lachnospiraceae bacterium]